MNMTNNILKIKNLIILTVVPLCADEFVVMVQVYKQSR